MSIFNFFKPKAATLTQPSPWLTEAITGTATASGMKVSALTVIGVPTVYACVNVVSRSIASLPLKFYKRRPDGGKEVAVNHPYYQLIHSSPNDEMTSGDFRRAMQGNASLYNQAYALIVRNGLGEVAELRPIPNREIKPMRDSEGVLYYQVNGGRVEKEKILHIKGLTFDGVQGADIIGTGKESLGLAIALQDHGASFFKNSSTPSIGIEIPTNLGPEQLKEFAKKWDAANTGNSNAHKRAILWGGAKFANRPSTNNQQGQFLESKIYQDKSICQLFGVPQIKAGITDAAHFNNVEQENQNYVNDTLMGWATQWEQTLNKQLLTPRDRNKYFFQFDFRGLLRGESDKRAEFYNKMWSMGTMSRNEIRSAEDLNPVEGGDLFVVSQNVQLLDETGKPVAKETPAPAPAPEPAADE